MRIHVVSAGACGEEVDPRHPIRRWWRRARSVVTRGSKQERGRNGGRSQIRGHKLWKEGGSRFLKRPTGGRPGGPAVSNPSPPRWSGRKPGAVEVRDGEG